jgi:hypothetical protein
MNRLVVRTLSKGCLYSEAKSPRYRVLEETEKLLEVEVKGLEEVWVGVMQHPPRDLPYVSFVSPME